MKNCPYCGSKNFVLETFDGERLPKYVCDECEHEFPTKYKCLCGTNIGFNFVRKISTDKNNKLQCEICDICIDEDILCN